MALKIGVNLPFDPKLPIEFEPIYQKIFGQPYYVVQVIDWIQEENIRAHGYFLQFYFQIPCKTEGTKV